MNNYSGLLKTERIIQYIQESVKSGKLGLNSKMPSIVKVAKELNVANETVVKAYNKLKERGVVKSVRGKGFFIAKTDFSEKRNVFVLFDALTSYKEILYNSMLKEFGNKASLDIYFHHFNIRLFESLVKEAAGKYTDYLILPFYDKKVIPVLEKIPREKLYIIDCYLEDFPCRGVFQDFKNDVFDALSSVPFPGGKYNKFNLIYHSDYNYVVSGIVSGFTNYCRENGIGFSVNNGVSCPEIHKGDAYLILDDEFMVDLVLQARAQNLKPGAEVGIISYNDTALKKIAEGGVSVVSTDFAKMGRDIASLILQDKNDCIRNPVMFIDRGSY